VRRNQPVSFEGDPLTIVLPDLFTQHISLQVFASRVQRFTDYRSESPERVYPIERDSEAWLRGGEGRGGRTCFASKTSRTSPLIGMQEALPQRGATEGPK
jgi:hypothetical protein